MKKFKIGDKVRAISDKGLCARSGNGWEGEVTNTLEGYFIAKTIKCKRNCNDICYNLKYENFELIEEKTLTFREVVEQIKLGEVWVSLNESHRIKNILCDVDGIRIEFKGDYHILGTSDVKFKLKVVKTERHIFLVEHSENGKQYKFRSKENSFRYKNEMVVCDTKYGHTYGKVIGRIKESLTYDEYKEYKEIWSVE